MRQANNSEHVQIGQTYCAAHTGHNLLVLCRYMVLVLVFVSPLFAVANAYGAGLTDFDMSSIYGTVRPLLLFPLAHCISVWIRPCSAAFSMCMRLNMHPCWVLAAHFPLLHDAAPGCALGQVVIFAFAAWAGTANGGVIAGLGISGFVMASTSSAATLMQVHLHPALCMCRFMLVLPIICNSVLSRVTQMCLQC